MMAFLAAVMLLIRDFFSMLIDLISSAEFFSLHALTAGIFPRPPCLPSLDARAVPNLPRPSHAAARPNPEQFQQDTRIGLPDRDNSTTCIHMAVNNQPPTG
jgi:hypothetical protein